jgi:myo-inositol 2-dehydrogenase/D-chiro-inositol 1-dehydrogenase
MSKEKVKIGIAGLGRIGKVHLENLIYRLPDAEVLVVMDINPELKELSTSLGVSKFYPNFQDLVDETRLDAIVICSPTDTHLEYIERAAIAGKHVFCEKPLSISVTEIDKIKSIIEKYRVKLQVGFNRRFDRNFVKLKSLVESGRIGDPHILKITSRDPAPPSLEYIISSGGMFMDMTIHDFDMARFITGSEVKEVFANGAVLVNPKIGEIGDIDTAIVTLTFQNGALATIDNSRQAVYGYDQRIEIFGSKGMSLVGNTYPDTHTIYDRTGGHTPPPLNFFMQRYTEAYLDEIKQFVHAIRYDKEVPVDAYDALRATQIARAARESLQKQKPIRLEY